MAAAAVAFLAGPAHAALPGDACAAFEGGCAQATMLSDADMGALRGGYRGVLFGISFFGDATAMLSQSDVNAPDGVSVEFSSDNVVSITAGLGATPDGFNGVFQNTQVLGDFNTVNNTLVINAVFLSETADASAFFTF